MTDLPDAVDLRPLGKTGLMTSPITVGTSGLGAATQPGSAEEEHAVVLAGAMVQGPYALIDTSNIYAGGRSEVVLGLALARRGAPGRRIVTKVDRNPLTMAMDRDQVWRSFEQSCARLGVDQVELLHLHDPYTVDFETACAPGGALQGLTELREQGLAGRIGVAVGRLSVLRNYLGTGAFDVILTHNRFTLVDRSAESVLQIARDMSMGTFNAAPFGGGLLAHGSASQATYHYSQVSTELRAWVNRAELLCTRHGVGLATVALHFSLRSPLVDSTVVGISHPRRLDQLEAMRSTVVPEALWPELTQLGPPPSPMTD